MTYSHILALERPLTTFITFITFCKTGKKKLDEVALGRETVLKTLDYRKIRESNGYRQFSEKFIKNVHVENSVKVLCSTFFV